MAFRNGNVNECMSMRHIPTVRIPHRSGTCLCCALGLRHKTMGPTFNRAHLPRLHVHRCTFVDGHVHTAHVRRDHPQVSGVGMRGQVCTEHERVARVHTTHVYTTYRGVVGIRDDEQGVIRTIRSNRTATVLRAIQERTNVNKTRLLQLRTKNKRLRTGHEARQ